MIEEAGRQTMSVRGLRAHASGRTAPAATVGALLACLIGAFSFLTVASAASAKSIDSRIARGEVAIEDVAVNEGTSQIYLAATSRVLRLAADGTPQLSWGKDVVAGNVSTGYEVCHFDTDNCQAGINGQQKGEFQGGPGGIAIDQSDGSVYVWDTRNGNAANAENLRIQKFDADGNFILMFGKDVNATTGADVCTEASGDLCQAGLETSELGGFGNPSTSTPGVAVSPIDGDVFVADSGGLSFASNRVQRFKADGTFVEAFGAPANFSTGRPDSIAIDSQGIVYADDGAPKGASEIERYDAYGVHGAPGFLSPIAAPPLLPATDDSSGNARITRLEVDLDSDGLGPDVDRLYVLRDPTAGETVVQQFDSPGQLIPPAAANQVHGEGNGFGAVRGFGLNEGSGSLYIAAANDLWVLTDGGTIDPPAVTAPAAANVTASTADLSAEVDPGGDEVTYHFEFATLDGEWVSFPERTLSGSGFQLVQEPVDGLQPNSEYKVRIFVKKLVGPGQFTTVGGTEEMFATDSAPPTVETLSISHRTSTSARIYGRVNPNSSPTSYRFEWGTDTTYGSSVPIPDGDAGATFGDQLLVEQLVGLEPETTYHYRVVAENGVEASPGVTEVAGGDMSFTTRAEAPTGEDRAFEMVTPPFKVVRVAGGVLAPVGDNPNTGVPSLDGNAFAWTIPFFPLTDEVGYPGNGDRRLFERTPTGWRGKTLNTVSLESTPQTPALVQTEVSASSGDLRSYAWSVNSGLCYGLDLPYEGPIPNRLYTVRPGTGVLGFWPWLSNPSTQADGVGFLNSIGGSQACAEDPHVDQALLNDDGSAMLRWGHYRGLSEDPQTPGDDDPSDDQQLPGNPGGAAVYLQRSGDPDLMPAAPKELVSECSGSTSEGDATRIPARVGNGTATDTIGSRDCEKGTVTSSRGATAGGGLGGVTNIQPERLVLEAATPASGPIATAISDDGRRAFFASPDPTQLTAPASCAASTGDATSCPPQLFVRQIGDEGEPVVRWISRSRSEPVGEGGYGGAPIADQRVAEMGAGVAFQGASRDGDVVYFKTNAPLTPDDPNGGKSITEDAASSNSWDLYRYELPSGLDQDPDDGVLMRVSGGPGGSADPSVSSSDGLEGGVLRFHSDDGSRAYFLTTAPLTGADSTPPVGGATTPGGTVGNGASRNLYLFDADESGAERYRFIARIPFSKNRASLSSCAAYEWSLSLHIANENSVQQGRGNCFHGTRDGRQITFFTGGQLTVDDEDEVGDVYFYDAEEDELVRVTAPPENASPYSCLRKEDQTPTGHCHGDFSNSGFWGSGGQESVGEMSNARGWGGARYLNIAKDANGIPSVYFQSRSQLVPEDQNGNDYDVYQWREGEVSLVSRGLPGHNSWYSGSSLDGRDVFVFTSDRIDPREIDDGDLDIYDARIGGGFPYTPAPPPCNVLALECEGPRIAAPAPPSASTLATGPSGNLAPRNRCRKLKGQAKRRCIRRQVRKVSKVKRKGTRATGAKRDRRGR